MGWRETTDRVQRSFALARSVSVTLATILLLSACGGHDVTSAPLEAPDEVSELDEAEAPGAGFRAPALIPVVW
jgi:hypothetical protein